MDELINIRTLSSANPLKSQKVMKRITSSQSQKLDFFGQTQRPQTTDFTPSGNKFHIQQKPSFGSFKPFRLDSASTQYQTKFLSRPVTHLFNNNNIQEKKEIKNQTFFIDIKMNNQNVKTVKSNSHFKDTKSINERLVLVNQNNNQTHFNFWNLAKKEKGRFYQNIEDEQQSQEEEETRNDDEIEIEKEKLIEQQIIQSIPEYDLPKEYKTVHQHLLKKAPSMRKLSQIQCKNVNHFCQNAQLVKRQVIDKKQIFLQRISSQIRKFDQYEGEQERFFEKYKDIIEEFEKAQKRIQDEERKEKIKKELQKSKAREKKIDVWQLRKKLDIRGYVNKIYEKLKNQKGVGIKDFDGNQNNPQQCGLFINQQETIKNIYNLIDQMNIMIRQYNHDKEKYIQSKQEICDYLKVNDTKLTLQELDIVIKEYSKEKKKKIDYTKLEDILSKLKFFSGFNPLTRKQLMKLGILQKKERGEIVFRQGDYGDQMYVIIFGSCSVLIRHITGDGQEISRAVTTLYDGFQFGELAMMKTSSKKQNEQKGLGETLNEKDIRSIKVKLQRYEEIQKMEKEYTKKGIFRSRSQMEELYEQQKEKNNQNNDIDELDEGNQTKRNQKQILERTKRAATIQCIEDTYLLSISKNDFQQVLMSLIQDELDTKIRLLSSMHLFEMFQPFALIPLANLLKIQKYTLNDVVVQQDKPIEKFYIVFQGRLKVIRVEKVHREKKVNKKYKNMTFNSEFRSKKQKKSLLQSNKSVAKQSQMFGYSKNDIENDLLENEEELEDEILEKPLRKSFLYNANSAFDFQELKSKDKKAKYYKHFVEYNSLSQGDYFGGRAITGKIIDYESNDAKLSIIADCNDVELYTLDKNQLQFLPQFFKDLFLQGLTICKEFDQINKEEEIEKIQKWEEYKEKIFKQYSE